MHLSLQFTTFYDGPQPSFRPSGKRLIVSNDARGISRLANLLKEAQPECVVLEATGGYEIKFLERLLAESLPLAVAANSLISGKRPGVLAENSIANENLYLMEELRATSKGPSDPGPL